MKNLSIIDINNTLLHWYFKILLALYGLLLVGYYDFLPMSFIEYKVLLDNITLKSAYVMFLITGMYLAFRNKFGYAKEANKLETYLGHLSLLLFINVELIYFSAHREMPVMLFDIDIGAAIGYVNWLLVLNLIVLAYRNKKLYIWGTLAIILISAYTQFIQPRAYFYAHNHQLPGYFEFWSLFGLYLFVFYFNRIPGLKEFCMEKFCPKPKVAVKRK